MSITEISYSETRQQLDKDGKSKYEPIKVELVASLENDEDPEEAYIYLRDMVRYLLYDKAE